MKKFIKRIFTFNTAFLILLLAILYYLIMINNNINLSQFNWENIKSNKARSIMVTLTNPTDDSSSYLEEISKHLESIEDILDKRLDYVRW